MTRLIHSWLVAGLGLFFTQAMAQESTAPQGVIELEGYKNRLQQLEGEQGDPARAAQLRQMQTLLSLMQRSIVQGDSSNSVTGSNAVPRTGSTPNLSLSPPRSPVRPSPLPPPGIASTSSPNRETAHSPDTDPAPPPIITTPKASPPTGTSPTRPKTSSKNPSWPSLTPERGAKPSVMQSPPDWFFQAKAE